jgi:hypothetical protein
MPEWWTYALSDFLLFSPRTYYRLIQRYNESLWPSQILALALGAGLIAALRRPSPRTGRIVSAVVALALAWTSWAFVLRRYTTINWAAEYFVLPLAATALVFVWAGAIRGRLIYRVTGRVSDKVGFAMLVLGGVLYPLLAPLAGRPLSQAEIFSVAPDPTALAAAGLLLLAEPPARGWLVLAPALWCLVAGATAWAMGAAEAVVLVPTALLAPTLALLRGRRSP